MATYAGSLPQSMTSQAPGLSTHIYSTAVSDMLHPSLMGHMAGHATTSHNYPASLAGGHGSIAGVQGSLYGQTSGYTGHVHSMAGDTAASRHMAAISADYQTNSLQTAPSHGHARYYGNHVMAAHPYRSIHPGFDMTAFRRKTATRETTSALKAWLREHRDNPYPTKGDKIMLAMISRMTLTQVSTWFANARRRLKKDKTTAINDSLSDTEEDRDCEPSRVANYAAPNPTVDETKISHNADVKPPARPVKKCVQRLFSPEARTEIAIDNSSSPEINYGTEMSSPTETNYELNGRHITNAQLPPCSAITSRRAETETHRCTTSGAGSYKSKIWSINEIIGNKSTTSDSENDDVNVSHEADSYCSEESSSFVAQSGEESSSFVAQSDNVYPHFTWHMPHTESGNEQQNEADASYTYRSIPTAPRSLLLQI